MMKESYDILLRFLDWAVEKRARDRYRSVLGTKSGESVFCSALCHKFESQLKENVLGKNRFDAAWKGPCRFYSLGVEFGKRFGSMQEALDEFGVTASWLIVTEDSRFGLHRGEWFHDRDSYIVCPT